MKTRKEMIEGYVVMFEVRPNNHHPFIHYDIVLLLLEEYAKHKCEEQKENCVGNMPAGISAYHPTTSDDIIDRVKNAPQPNFD